MIRIAGRWSLLLLFFFSAVLAARDRTVLILPLQYLTGPKDQAHLSRTVPDSLATSLRNAGGFRVLAVPDIPEKQEIGFELATAVAAKSNADIVITGSISILGGTADIGLEAIDTATKRVKVTEGARGPAGIELFDLVDGLCSAMSRKMAAELPAIQEYEVTREVTRIEEIYVNDLKKNHKFLLGLGTGLSASSASRPGNSASTFGGTGFLIMGYGYKWLRLGMAGCPPIPQIGPEGVLNTGWAYCTWDFARIPLIVGLNFHFIYQSAVEYGGNNMESFILSPMISLVAGARIGRTLRIGLSVGYSLGRSTLWTGTAEYPIRLRLPPLSLEAEWTFYREFGIYFRASYANIFTDGGHRAGILQLFPSFIYKTEF